MNVNEQKNELRKIYLKKRSEMTDKAAKDTLIFRAVTECIEFKSADLILLYEPIRNEVETRDIFLAAKKLGKRIAYPRCIRDGIMEFYLVDSLLDLELGSYGIREPKRDLPKLSDFDGALCIMPSLAVDRSGNRLGYGKGYYDHFLSENPEVIKLIPTYDELVCEGMVAGPFDIRADIIVTPKECIRINED